MNRKTANLRISHLGGGHDFPQFFEHSEIRILAEGANYICIGMQYRESSYTCF